MAYNEALKITNVRIDSDYLQLTLQDGRVIAAPLAWYPVLTNAAPAQRNNWRLCGGGFGVYWSDLNEHVSSENLLQGYRSRYMQPNHDVLVVDDAPELEETVLTMPDTTEHAITHATR